MTSHPEKPVLVLFRNDLRLSDNRALSAETGKPVLCAFIFDEGHDGIRPIGAARRWWLHHSLTALAKDLASLGVALVLRKGPMQATVSELVAASGADAVFWNRRYEPPAAAADGAMKEALRANGVRAESFDGALLHEPSRLTTGAGGPYKVFTPFWRALRASHEPRGPVDTPENLRPLPGTPPTSDRLADWRLLPAKPDWAGGLRDAWTPGEAGAHARLEAFLDCAIDGYAHGRDFPGAEANSRLSPHLAQGEITPFQILGALRSRGTDAPVADIDIFRKEVGWREFCAHLLFHNPHLAKANFNPAFDHFPWQVNENLLKSWRRGETGYPIVDAGMRQLWQTGWMHNRVRMIVASFLVKHLLLDWRAGEAWFWDTLVDADPASNPANWQWVAGSGADAAPYFRIFNPVLQGKKFDGDGDYVRRFVPEIATLSNRHLHSPWDAPVDELKAAKVKLGENYPVPVVDHAAARDRAMRAYGAMRGPR